MNWVGWVSIAAVVLAAVAIFLAVQNRRALTGHGVEVHPSIGAPGRAGAASTDTTDAVHVLVAFVANPTKPGVPQLRDAAVKACAARYLPEPMWFDTTVEDPGIGQAREAVEKGAQVVVAVGGDGTVRAVAEGLAGTGVAMGLLPQGTGNLLARNLDLPLNDVDELLRVALVGNDRAIDVGWLTVVRDESMVADDIAEADPHAEEPERTPPGAHEPARDHIFLVIAGLGFDAALFEDTDEDLKAKVGWVAYLVAGLKNLGSRRMRVELSMDDSPWRSTRLRSVMIGNCGRLQGGLTLFPEAQLDDGWLDVGTMDTRAGVLGWVQLVGEVTIQSFGMKTDLPNKIGKMDVARVRALGVRSREPQKIQVDGDTIGEALEIAARVDKQALTVRVP
jgi:diacylglycerol kinase (ATP)